MKKIVLFLLLVVLAFAVAPVHAAKYAQVDGVFQVGQSIVIIGKVHCPSGNIYHTAKVKNGRLSIYVYEKTTPRGGRCSAEMMTYKLYISGTANSWGINQFPVGVKVFVNGKYRFDYTVEK